MIQFDHVMKTNNFSHNSNSECNTLRLLHCMYGESIFIWLFLVTMIVPPISVHQINEQYFCLKSVVTNQNTKTHWISFQANTFWYFLGNFLILIFLSIFQYQKFSLRRHLSRYMKKTLLYLQFWCAAATWVELHQYVVIHVKWQLKRGLITLKDQTVIKELWHINRERKHKNVV